MVGACKDSIIAELSADSLSTGTNVPHLPSCSISRGPLGQSVLMTGVPQASASISTVGSPSQKDERTNKRLAFRKL